MISVLKPVFLAVVIFATFATGLRHEYNPNSKYALSWEIIDDVIDFVVTVKTTGWVGLGLNSEPRMDGADLVIGGLDNGTEYLLDCHGVNHSPVPDNTTNWAVGSVAFVESADEITLSYSRKLITGDVEDHPIEDSDLILLWSYGEDDNLAKPHLAKGTVKINLINPNITSITA